MIGKQLGHYELTDALGKGGMGEVYRARDTKLGREVAIKVLPEALSGDPERAARFEREARLLASLQHANVASIYGFEHTDSVQFLAMELVEGQTLEERLREGAPPAGEVLRIAGQMATGLEAAHERGIVHRDLKPANVMLTRDGEVKILDFGLARAWFGEDPAEESISASPTITAAMTQAGTILGTAGYMSPEQARGKPIDKRADIWAFGVMLWEMLSGQRLFAGETVSDTLAAVLRQDPEWDVLPADTPPRIRRLVRRCLERNPRERLRDIGDARILIEEVLAGDRGEESGVQTAPAPRPRLPRVLVGIGVLAAVAAAFVGGRHLAGPGQSELPLRKFVLPIPDLKNSLVNGTTVAIAADGSRIAYTSEGLLWVRDLDRVEPRKLAGTEGAIAPFWSPDGEWVAYAAGQKLWKIRATGGEPLALCELQRNSAAGGGVWRSDGDIVFCNGYGPLLTVSSQGGDPDTLLALDPEADEDFHNVIGLPGERALVFVVHAKDGTYQRIDAFADGVRHEVLRHEGQKIRALAYSPSGHLIYHREPLNAGVWAVPFSPDELKVTGKPFLAVPGGELPHVSADGTLVHAIGARSSDNELLVVTRDGAVERALGEARAHQVMPSFSPDGRRVAVSILGENDDVWILDVQRGTQTRLTLDPGSDKDPTWSPDGERIYYGHGDTWAVSELRMRAADGTGEATSLGRGLSPSVSADGKLLFYTYWDVERASLDLHYLPLGEDGLAAGEATPFLATDTQEWDAQLSPAGDYVVYSSFESGQPEIYLKRFPSGDGKWQVTSAGGHWPVWSATADELFFARGLDLMTVPVQTDPKLQLGTPSVLFTRESDTQSGLGGWPDAFDVTADGRFLIVRPADVGGEKSIQGFVVTQSWFSEFSGTE